ADGLTVSRLSKILGDRARQLKPLLLDQHVIAGIGNIYCDEILHRARLRPDRLANSLKPAEVRRLHDAIHSILETAIAAGGSTLSDTQYVDVMGDGGSFQLDHRVYDRAGQRCLTCGKATIVRVVSGGRSTCYCPRCQR
ncbi:MAG: formamidopyrimidine-DNA glycosylase, partial [Ilumatobacteraceae bacterium]|nr:formamidopyrimidine-DNA glycosylase [Ilumatobacteraceae bacterium]